MPWLLWVFPPVRYNAPLVFKSISSLQGTHTAQGEWQEGPEGVRPVRSSTKAAEGRQANRAAGMKAVRGIKVREAEDQASRWLKQSQINRPSCLRGERFIGLSLARLKRTRSPSILPLLDG